MASDEDNFDIDVYGDGEGDKADQPVDSGVKEATDAFAVDQGNTNTVASHEQPQAQSVQQGGDGLQLSDVDHTHEESALGHDDVDDDDDIIITVDGPSRRPQEHSQLPVKQGVKRKEPDDRPLDGNATPAVFISELHWWSTDDDIRGWANRCQCEDELKDITFSEYKVNGKSKGQAFVEFTSPQAATAFKRRIETEEAAQNGRKFAVTYTSASVNPYRTLPKDAPVRSKDGPGSRDSRSPGGHSSPGWVPNLPNQGGGNMPMNNFRGGRGGFNNRGSRMNNNMAGFPNRNFSGAMGVAPSGGFQGAPMAGFPAMMGGMNPFVGGFPNRGNMMGGMGGMRGGPVGARGGRGGMSPNGMMTGMGNMGNMGGGMMGGMGGPMGGMGMNPMGVQGMQAFHHQQRQQPAVSGTGHSVMNHFPPGVHRPQTPFSFSGNFPLTSAPPSTASSHSVHYPAPPGMNTSLNRNAGSHHLGQGGFQAPPTHFNPAFFGQNQAAGGGGGDGNWNPHGTKRQRPE